MNQPEPIGLGDVVSSGIGDYSCATVSQVHEDGTVDIFRPYVHTDDFSMAGSQKGSSKVITYIGFEEVKRLNPSKLTLLRKSPPLR